MTLTLPADCAALYTHMTLDALMAHIEAAVAALEERGVTLTPEARTGIDSVAECVLEHAGRTEPLAFARLARAATRASHTGLNG